MDGGLAFDSPEHMLPYNPQFDPYIAIVLALVPTYAAFLPFYFSVIASLWGHLPNAKGIVLGFQAEYKVTHSSEGIPGTMILPPSSAYSCTDGNLMSTTTP